MKPYLILAFCFSGLLGFTMIPKVGFIWSLFGSLISFVVLVMIFTTMTSGKEVQE